MVIKGTTLEGDEITKTVALQLGEAGADGRKRLADAGLQLVPLGGNVQVGAVKFGSRAKRGGFESGWDVTAVKVPTGRAQPALVLPAGAAAAGAGVVEPGAATALGQLSARLHCARQERAAAAQPPRPPKAQGREGFERSGKRTGKRLDDGAFLTGERLVPSQPTEGASAASNAQRQSLR